MTGMHGLREYFLLLGLVLKAASYKIEFAKP